MEPQPFLSVWPTRSHPFAPGLAEVAVVLGEEVPDVRYGPVLVVGQDLDEDRHPAGTVSLVQVLLEDDPLELPGPLLDRPRDVVVRHVHGAGRVDRLAKSGDPFGVAAPDLRRGDELPRDLGEGPAAPGGGLPPPVLDRAPF